MVVNEMLTYCPSIGIYELRYSGSTEMMETNATASTEAANNGASHLIAFERAATRALWGVVGGGLLVVILFLI